MPETKTTIHFVRHGQVYNPDDIFYGRLPGWKLSAEGLRQAQSLGPFFAGRGIKIIHSSPLLRARQTAQIISTLLDPVEVKISASLLECHTPYDGTPGKVLTQRNYDIYTGNTPPFEQPLDVFRRTQRFIRRVLKARPGEEVIAVTHADVIVFLTLWAQGYEVSFQNKSRIEHRQIPLAFPAPASVTSLTWNGADGLPQFAYFPNSWQAV
ncbi:MAG TPA: histidine phosphatase family protein [Anaerolineaceae bacterium]|nr:histidine phosphatase family protein [Anaerolineaceae bacterium]HPN54136.1 histidine phosphatase family protein [Anaerolineaceae bacterium]